MLDIVQAPNSVLSQVAKPVGKIDKAVRQLVQEMKETLSSTKDPEGVGLAASQVGKSLQIFIAKPTPKSKELVFINPRVTAHVLLSEELEKETQKKKKKKSKAKLEGCLSLVDIWGTVKRAPSVSVSYLDENGKNKKKNFRGFLATIIQHEDDHLNGILFPKRVLEQGNKLYKSSKNEKGQDVFDEIEI